MRRWRPNLRLRLGLGALTLAVLAILAAGIAAFGLSQMQRLASEAMAAQHRIESFSSLSARMNEWMIGRLVPDVAADSGASASQESFAVMATFALLDMLIAEDVAAAPDAAAANLRERQVLTLARIRGQFTQLEQSLKRHRLDSPQGNAALSFYAAQVPAMIAGQIQGDSSRRDVALGDMARLRDTLHLLAIGVAVAVPLVLIALYALLVRPLIRRLNDASRGETAGSTGDHDELAPAFARLRQRAARLDRRQRRLTQDYARLEGIVTERTAALSHANARLSQADAQRRRFFADVSHELRTPLTVILGEAELGLRDADPARRGTFATIQSRALRLYQRIEDLLRIARSESGQLDLQRAPVDLAGVIDAARTDLQPILKRAGIATVIKVPAGFQVSGDADWLRQVFAGLFENAAKYAGKGAVLTVRGIADGRDAVIEVTDTGPGVPANGLATMFDRFTRGDARAPGFGVGLALVRWVVQAQGGAITAFSPVAGGQGFGLRITLPLCADVIEIPRETEHA